MSADQSSLCARVLILWVVIEGWLGGMYNDLRIDITWLLSLHLYTCHGRRCEKRYAN